MKKNSKNIQQSSPALNTRSGKPMYAGKAALGSTQSGAGLLTSVTFTKLFTITKKTQPYGTVKK